MAGWCNNTPISHAFRPKAIEGRWTLSQGTLYESLSIECLLWIRESPHEKSINIVQPSGNAALWDLSVQIIREDVAREIIGLNSSIFFFNKNRLGWQFLKSPARCDSWNSSVFDAVKAVVPLLTQSVWRSDAEIGFSTFPCWWSATLWPLWQFGSRLAGVRKSSKRSLQLKNIKKM